MTWTAWEGKGTFEHFKLWVDYAIKHDPKRLCLGVPWDDSRTLQNRYFHLEMKKATAAFHKIIDRLREAYPENEFFCINYGQGAELKKLYHAGKLNAVDGQTKSRDRQLESSRMP